MISDCSHTPLGTHKPTLKVRFLTQDSESTLEKEIAKILSEEDPEATSISKYKHACSPHSLRTRFDTSIISVLGQNIIKCARTHTHKGGLHNSYTDTSTPTTLPELLEEIMDEGSPRPAPPIMTWASTEEGSSQCLFCFVYDRRAAMSSRPA